MRIFLTGVSCVGKTSVGESLAALVRCPFFDLDKEIEIFFGKPLERLQDTFLTMYSFRKEAAKALCHILALSGSGNCVIALPPSGLMDSYWRVVKKAGGRIVVLEDSPENILKRITFYDKDSQPLDKDITEEEAPLYIAEIKKDLSYFRRTYKRAHVWADISGLDVAGAARKVKEHLDRFVEDQPGHKREEVRTTPLT